MAFSAIPITSINELSRPIIVLSYQMRCITKEFPNACAKASNFSLPLAPSHTFAKENPFERDDETLK